MNDDIKRFIVVILLSFFAGLITGMYLFCLSLGLFAFICWQYQQYKNILIWLKKRNESYGPEQTGMVDDICREVDSIKKRHNIREKKLGLYLKQFQNATNALPDAIVVLGEHGEIDWANKKAEEYLGIIWPKDASMRISNLVRKNELDNFLNGSNTHVQLGFELKSPVNSQVQLEIRISPYGEIQNLLVARDISNIVKTNQMRKDFIANASHELRTPLTVISGYLESFVDDTLCPQEWLPYIRQMRSQTSRMQSLIEDLLTLSSLEANQGKAEKDIVQVPIIISNIVKEAITLSGLSMHEINAEIDDKLFIYGHQNQLYSAFSNIIFNAVRYTPEKTEISISWSADEYGAHLIVADNGNGFEKEHIPRLTERFYRIDKGRSRERGGTGLGLAIVKHVMVRHDADLRIKSEPGKGSEFSCHFPVQRIMTNDISKEQILVG